MINEFRPASMSDLKKAHKILMKGLLEKPGEFRTSGVGLVKGNKVTHLAPPSHLVKSQVSELFKYVKSNNELSLIKSCVVHYELEFIHPFLVLTTHVVVTITNLENFSFAVFTQSSWST